MSDIGNFLETMSRIYADDLKVSFLKTIKKYEWKMGNGQCWVCCGCKPYSGWWTKEVGHKKNCQLAKMLSKEGYRIVWERKNYSKRVKQHKVKFKELNERFMDSLISIPLFKEPNKKED